MSSDYSQLSDVAEVIDSLHKTPSYAVQGLPMVRVTDVKYGELLLDGTLKVDEQTFMEFSRRYKPNREDIVITRVGTYGITARVVETAFCLGQNTAAIIPRSINSRYLYAALNSPQLRAQIESNAVGSTQKTLSLKCINALQIPRLGEYAETKIAELIGILDDRIALLRETNATLEAIVQALFKSWFVDFEPVHARARGEQPAGLAPEVAALFPDSFEESALGMVPKGWNTGTLGDVAHFQNGYAFKSKDWCESGHPVVKIGDVKPGIIDFSGCSYIAPETTEGLSRFKLRRGDLLVGMTGYVGETGLVPHVEPHAYLNQRVGRIATKSGLIDLGFVYCLVRNSAFKGYAEARSHGSAQANVSGAVLLDYPVVTPTQNILDRFNGSVGVLLERILSNHEQAQTLANLRDTLLPRLISGQLRLPEAEAMVEGAS